MHGPDLLTALAKAHVGERRASDDEVRAGLRSAEAPCRELATAVACEDPYRHSPALIEAWFRDGASRPRIIGALRRDPLLVLESLRPTEILDAAADREGGPTIDRWFAPARAAEAIRTFSSSGCSRSEGQALLRQLPGLWKLVACGPGVRDEDRAWHAQRLEEHEDSRFPGQIGIIPSYRCNRSCDYCFSSQRQHPGRRDMTLEQLRRVLDVTTSQGGLTRIHLFGGEPTFFDGAPEFIEEFERRRLGFFFATNGVGPEDRIRRLVDSAALLQVTLHVEPRGSYSEEEWRSIVRTARIVHQRSIRAVIRFNFTTPDEASWEYLDPFVEAMPRAHVSFAVVFPAADGRNHHASLEELFRFAPAIARFAAWARRRWGPVTLVLAKPFPLCAFSERELADVLGAIEYHNICEIRRRRFTDQVMVHPDLTVSPCMAVTSAAYRQPEPLPLPELAERVAASLAPLVARPLLPRCGSCGLFGAGACQAACYAYAQ
jgi:hypothetical protein